MHRRAGFADRAKEIFAAKKNLRLLELPPEASTRTRTPTQAHPRRNAGAAARLGEIKATNCAR